GDFNADGVVDAADYTLWRDNLGAPDESALNNNGDGGGVSASDYIYWRDRYGNTASVSADEAGAASAPEPASAILLGFLSALVLGSRRSRLVPSPACCLSFTCALALATTALGAQNDRQYDFGDDPFETASDGAPMSGTTFDSEGTVGAGDLQDLFVNGAPSYVSVSDRPGALVGDLGASFNGSSDSLSTPISMNAPTQMWDNGTFFPGPPPQIFPHNYEGIFSHGIQLWAKPDQLALGSATQTLVSDTNEHGIGITAAGNWELLYDDGRFDTGVSVVSTLDVNGWAHLMEISEPGGDAFGGTLLINGVAVMARPTFYDPEATPLVIGADAIGTSINDGYENFYDGVLDDVRLFFWGDNSNQLGADGVAGGINSGGPLPTPIVLNADGQDWGGLDLGATNDWIAQKLISLGVTDPADVNLSGGLPNAADETAFVTHWRKQQVIDGVRIGDWNSRQEGDLNYDGIVDLRDAFILHEGLVAAGLGGFDFSLLSGAPAPEPCTAALAVFTLMAAGSLRRTRS
ncbi:MAG: hypothetical protein KDA37_16895, partial [Planctomycetales bacterium]|nr:hypothetical protein [Planctomycetales bacterium]